MEDSPAYGESPGFVLWNSQTKSLKTQQRGRQALAAQFIPVLPTGLCLRHSPAGQRNLQLRKKQLFAKVNSSVLHTRHWEVWITLYSGSLQKNSLLAWWTSHSGCDTFRETRSKLSTQKTKGSVKPFEIKNIHIPAKMTPPSTPNVGLFY